MLSKSQFIRGLQCPKSLWLYKNRPELREQPDVQTESLFNTGYEVGDLAKERFPGGIEIPFDAKNFDGMVKQTSQLIAEGAEIIYEATFKQRGVFAMADILVKKGNKWDIYEVKASTKVKEYHRNDAAVQWYALSNVLSLNKAYIVHIDNTYVRNGSLDVWKLFSAVDITEDVKERQSEIQQQLNEMEQVIAGDEPDQKIGTQCSDPHACDFSAYCWKDVPQKSVFNLYRLSSNTKFDWYYQGIKRLEDIPAEFKLTDTQNIQVESAISQQIFLNKEVINEFIDSVKYPINFFDFETFQNAVPRFNNQRPYQQLPFQYSLHILHQDGRLEHKEFLADENEDPRDTLIEHMLTDLTPEGSIVAYNQSFEKGRIKELAEFNPKHKQALLALNERFVDLLHPFQKLGYYHPEFNGSFSIKSVLPAMFPNDPELDYKQLDIQNGGMAMDIFANLHKENDKTVREQIRKNLLAYCRLDTLAMVKILGKLHGFLKISA